MSNPFDLVNSINKTKVHAFPDAWTEESTKYDAYMINKVFSYHTDSLMFANVMNIHWMMPGKMQYDFYFHGLEKRPRFAKWHKPHKEQSLEVIKKAYNVSDRIAREYLKILKPSDIRHLEEKQYKGGLEKGRRR